MGETRIGINTFALQEKAVACNMLYQYASDLGPLFMPFVDRTAAALLPLLSFPYSGQVRVAAISAVPKLLLVGARHALSSAGGESSSSASSAEWARRFLAQASRFFFNFCWFYRSLRGTVCVDTIHTAERRYHAETTQLMRRQ